MSVKGFLRKFIIFVALFFLFLHTSIQLGRDYAVQWLLNQGAESAHIHSLSVNWFTGKVRLHGVHIITPDQPDLRLANLELDLDYQALFKKRILISALSIEGLSADLLQQSGDESSQYVIGPVQIPVSDTTEEAVEPDDSDSSDWLVGLDKLTISDLNWQARLPEGTHQLAIDQGSISTFYMWREQATTELKLLGSINGAQFDLDTRGQPLPETKRSEIVISLKALPVHSFTAPFVPGLKATLSADLTISVEAGEQIAITQKGNISVDNFSWQDSDLNLSQKSLGWQGDTDLLITESQLQKVNIKGELKAGALGLENPQLLVELLSSHWQGNADLQFNDGALGEINLIGGLQAKALNLQSEKRLQVELADLDWNGPLNVKLREPEVLVSGDSGTLQLSGFQLSGLASPENQQAQKIALLNRLNVKDINLSLPEELSVGSVDINALRVAPGSEAKSEQTLVSTDVQIQRIKMKLAEAVDIKQVRLSNLVLQETLDQAQQPLNVNRLLADLEQLQGPADNSQTAIEGNDSQPDKPLRVTLGKVVVAEDSKILFTDNSTQPVFSSEIGIVRAEINQLDTGSKQPARFDLGLKLNGFTGLDLSGSTNMAGGGDTAIWKGDLKQLDLPRLSPYSIIHTGYYLQNGQLHLSSKGELTDGKIDGTNHIQINRLEVEVADQDQMSKFSKKLSMPLGTAISVLQDSDDNIDLDIPVTGSLDDPDFGIQSVINRLAGKGLKQAAFSFLTKSLQPYGALISLAVSVAQDGSFISLQPVAFSPGKAGLDDTGRDYLTKISTMMSDRKGMRLNICGQVVQQDQALIRTTLEEQNKKRDEPLTAEQLAEEELKQLTELAQLRTDAVKTQLIASIPGERLFGCFPVPRLDDPKALPTATLGL